MNFNSANPYLALPAIFGNGGHDWFEAERVISFVTSVANEHFVVVSGIAACLADLALGTLPTGAHGWGYLDGGVQASTVVMKATGSAEQLFSDVTGEFANDAVSVFDVRLGSHIARVLGAKEFQPEREWITE